jgi:hypothetical protein
VSKRCHRMASAGLAVFLILFLMSGAESRHHRHHRHHSHHSHHRGYDDDRGLDHSEPAAPSQPGPLGALLSELIGDCERQLIDLKNLPTDSIARAIEADDAQAALLKDIRRTAEGTATIMAAACPMEDQPMPLQRLAAAERWIEAVETAMNALQQPLEKLYQSLRDEQRGTLAAGILDVDADVSGDVPTPMRSRRNDHARPDSRAAVRAWDCGRWVEELRGWPAEHIQQSLHLMPRQGGSFYEMVAFFQFAADNLEDSCPRQALPTPIGRLLYMKDKLESLHQSAMIIRAPLQHLYELLDDGQKARFGAEM